MPGTTPKTGGETFPAELRSFYTLCLLSLALGALALASGLRFIAGSVAAVAGVGTFSAFRLLEALAGWAAAVIGFRWILSTGRILRGVGGILMDYQALEEPAEGEPREGSPPGKTGENVLVSEKPVEREAPGGEPAGGSGGGGPGSGSEAGGIPPGAIDGLIGRMRGHYRENWKTYWKIALISRLGGWIFVFLGVLDFIDGYSAWRAGGGPHLFILAGGIAIALGIASIHVSSRFRSYARAWEGRLGEAGQGEEFLYGPGEQKSP